MTSRNNSQGVEVVLDCLKDSKTPRCPHGPTLLFERYGIAGKGGQRFYACSACRDRKECNFFQHEDAVVSKATKLAREEELKRYQPRYTHEQFHQRLLRVKEKDVKDRKFCHTCHLLLLPNEWNDHKTHLIKENLSDDDILNPSKLLSPLENNKSNAQFLFSEDTNRFLVSCIKKLGFTQVLCIGTPRLHEAIIMHNKDEGKEQLHSLLLDIDHRFMQFNGTNEFCYYNMFNHHFFDNEESQNVYEDFMKIERTKTVIIMDPPFGGLAEVLAHTLKIVSGSQERQEAETDVEVLPTFLFFPYYLEHRISEYMPAFCMSDYRVNYTNHESYQTGPKGRKHGSPVRLFTNINLKRIRIPDDLGYRWCKLCETSVHKNNKHCDRCNSCTSKDGSEYKHCDICKRCVKPSRIHCGVCNMCVLADHECGKIHNTGCHICGEQGHKRRECPKRHEIWSKNKAEKRKRQADDGGSKKKLKKILKKRRKKTQKNI